MSDAERWADAFVAGYMTAVKETIGHTRQILSPIVWNELDDRLQQRAEKLAREAYEVRSGEVLDR